jgi:uncharacterized protein (DUF3820 family)
VSELAKALVEAQKKLPAVPKNATAKVPTKSGGSYSYSYATLDSLIAKTLPVLNANGLAITQAPEYIDGFGLGLRTTLSHTSGETQTSLMPIPHAGHSMQDLGGAITYARRYAWSAVLGIASEHDDDAEAITHESRGGTTVGNGSPGSAQHQSPSSTGAAASSTTFKQPDTVTPATIAGTDPGTVELTFGKHKGCQIKDVPRAYLAWWLTQEPPKNEAQKAQRAAAELYLMGATSDVAHEPGPIADADIPFSRTFA